MTTGIRIPTSCLVLFSLFVATIGLSTGFRVFYVHPDNNNSSCPSPKDQNVTCYPFDHYYSTQNQYFKSDVQMVFLTGTHFLKKNITVDSVQNFTMTNMNEIHEPSRIVCSQSTPGSLFFVNSNYTRIENLHFDKCGAEVILSNNFSIHAALVIQHSYGLNLTRITITKSAGFGLHLENVLGSVYIGYSCFSENKGDRNYHGGNVRIWYGNCPDIDNVEKTLTIESSLFSNGKDRQDNIYSRHYNASGLNVFLYCKSINVYIDNVTAENNTATGTNNVGNMAFRVVDYTDNSSTIRMTNSQISNGSGSKGAGLIILVNSTNSNYTSCKEPISSSRQTPLSLVEIHNTSFINNTANLSAGAVHILDYQYGKVDCTSFYIKFVNCTFENNSVTIHGSGAAVMVQKIKASEFQHHSGETDSGVEFQDCTFVRNYIQDYTMSIGSIMDLVSANVLLNGSRFIKNNGTAISLSNSILTANRTVHFENNHALYGGALKFCVSSFMYITNITRIIFKENQALNGGGAIYAQHPCMDKILPCFFQPTSKNATAVVDYYAGRLEFINNSAIFAGDAIYGGAIEHCSTFQFFNTSNSSGVPGHFLSIALVRTIFNFSHQNYVGNSTISSDPYGICFCVEDKFDCKKSRLTYQSPVYPGQNITLSAVAVGQWNGTVPAFIEPSVKNKELNTNETLILHDKYKTKNRCINLIYNVRPRQPVKYVIITLKVGVTSPTGSITSHAYPSINVPIEKCPWGFSKSDEGICTCELALQELQKHVQCNIGSKTIEWTDPNLWIGRKGDEVIYSKSCVLCNPNSMNITEDTIDNQCYENLMGTICTSCANGSSRVFGTSRCRQCSNHYLSLLILYLLAGIILVAFLAIFNLTVAEGTISGLVFYASIIHANNKMFFKNIFSNNIFRIFIAWLNLDLGFEVCFYQGMTTYEKIWLQFGFLFYMWLLQIAIILLSRRFIFFTKLMGRNIVQVLMTVKLLYFGKLVQTCCNVFQFKEIHYLNKSKLVWAYDGDLKYFHGKHIPLVVVALTFALIGLFLLVGLIFIQCLQRGSNFLFIRWIQRFRPFFDAYTGPYRNIYRFWPGLRALVRGALIIGYTLQTRGDEHLNLIYTIIACILLTVLACLFPRGVYKKWPLNILEFSFFLNLFVTSLTFLYYNKPDKKKRWITYTSVIVAMLTFTGILIYHGYRQLMTSYYGKRLVKYVSQVCPKQKNRRTSHSSYRRDEPNENVHHNNPNSSDDTNMDSEREPLLTNSRPRFDRLREPLIADD